MKDFFHLLFKKYNQNSIPKQDRAVVDKWYQKNVDDTNEAPNEQKVQEEIWLQLVQQIRQEPKVRFLHTWKWAAAAILCIILGVATYLIMENKTSPLNIAAIQPAIHRALISTDVREKEEEITSLSKSVIIRNLNEIQNIQVVAPKGASFDFTLPDGTKVFLNSDSKICYPSQFTGEVRRVTLEGEAYFEVTHDKEKPFIVKTVAGAIKVLGTKFNVRAYANMTDNLVSLLEGSVQLSNQFTNTLLKPGEMASIQKDAKIIPVKDIGDADPIAWKSGYFNFDNMPISELILELGRWYNVKFDVSQLKKDIKLNGRIARDRNLKVILELLSTTDEIHFETKEQTIVIKNN